MEKLAIAAESYPGIIFAISLTDELVETLFKAYRLSMYAKCNYKFSENVILKIPYSDKPGIEIYSYGTTFRHCLEKDSELLESKEFSEYGIEYLGLREEQCLDYMNRYNRNGRIEHISGFDALKNFSKRQAYNCTSILVEEDVLNFYIDNLSGVGDIISVAIHFSEIIDLSIAEK